jgi:hypothetical protein
MSERKIQQQQHHEKRDKMPTALLVEKLQTPAYP